MSKELKLDFRVKTNTPLLDLANEFARQLYPAPGSGVSCHGDGFIVYVLPQPTSPVRDPVRAIFMRAGEEVAITVKCSECDKKAVTAAVEALTAAEREAKTMVIAQTAADALIRVTRRIDPEARVKINYIGAERIEATLYPSSHCTYPAHSVSLKVRCCLSGCEYEVKAVCKDILDAEAVRTAFKSPYAFPCKKRQ